MERGFENTGGGLTQPANGGVAHRLSHFLEHADLLGDGGERPAVNYSFKRLLLTDRADTARDALAAALVAKKLRDAQENALQVDTVVERHHNAGAKRRADGPHALKGQRRIQLGWRNERAGRASEQYSFQPSVASEAARQFDRLAQRRAEGNFIHAWAHHVAAKAKELVSGGIFRSDARVGGSSGENNFRNVDQCFDVIHDGRLPEQALLRWKRRLIPGLTAIAFYRIKQRGLFAADVRAGATAQLDVEAKAAAANVIAEESLCAGKKNGLLKALGGQRIFSANVNVTPLRADGKGGDGHPFEDGERIALQHHVGFKSPGLGFIGVADAVARTGPRVDPFPFFAGGKSGAAAADQARLDHFTDHALGPQIERLFERLITSEAAIIVEARCIDQADTAQQAKLRLTGLRNRAQDIRFAMQGSFGCLPQQIRDGIGCGRSKDALLRLFPC